MKHWYTWISNTTSITGETLRYNCMKHWYTWISKHYKYNWKNIYTWISNTTSITGETLIYMNIKTLQV